VSFSAVTNDSVLVRWRRPLRPNGVVQGYRLYYMHGNYTDVKTVREPTEAMQYTLDGLGECLLPRSDLVVAVQSSSLAPPRSPFKIHGVSILYISLTL